MKRYIAAVAIVASFCLHGCGTEQRPSEEATKQSFETAQKPATTSRMSGKYEIKSGIIHFEGSDFNGTHTEIVYFDDYGRKERMERFDSNGVLAEAKFCDGNQLYTISTDDQIVYIMSANAKRGTEMEFNPNSWSERQKEKYRFRDEPEMTIAGKKCAAFSSETSAGKATYGGWARITLYYSIESKYGTITKRAIRLEENVPVPSDKFAVPSNFKVQKAM